MGSWEGQTVERHECVGDYVAVASVREQLCSARSATAPCLGCDDVARTILLDGMIC